MNTLKDYVNWKLTHADKVAEAEGYPLTMENCKKYKKMKQLEVYGNSVQEGTPTPENPIEVQSVGEFVTDETDANYGKYKIPVVQRGINYHNYKKFNYKEQTINGITFTPLDDGTFHLKGKLADSTQMASYRVVIWNAIPVKAGTYHSKKNGNLTVMFGAYKKDGKFWMNIHSASNSGNATLSEDGYIGYCQIVIDANTTKEFNEIVYPQLTKGTEDLPYEPYVEPITTNIFLNEPLRKIGDYADYIDFKGEKVVRNIRELIPKPEDISYRHSSYGEKYGYYVYGIGTFYYDAYIDDFYNWGHNLQPEKATHFKAYTFRVSEMLAHGEWYFNNRSRLCFLLSQEFQASDGVSSTLTDIQAWMQSQIDAGTPLKFTYRLKEPTQEPISLELPKLTAKTTIIEVDTSLAPSDAYGKYIKR